MSKKTKYTYLNPDELHYNDDIYLIGTNTPVPSYFDNEGDLIEKDTYEILATFCLAKSALDYRKHNRSNHKYKFLFILDIENCRIIDDVPH